MSEFDREKLKKHFRQGALPAAEHYADLIDSTVNKFDDGFRKDPEGGLRVASLGNQFGLLSFSKGAGAPVSWKLSHTREENLTLAIPSNAKRPGLTLTQAGPIGINRLDPAYSLDVGGPVRATGRVGDVPDLDSEDAEKVVVADGEWHAITPALSGCHALEVIAGVGGEKGKGHYALIHAVALNTYAPTNCLLNFFKWLLGCRKIRRQSAVYGRFADRLRLRWKSVGRGSYKLEIRTSTDYGTNEALKGSNQKNSEDSYYIRYGVTRLWFDDHMDGSRSEEAFVPVDGGLPVTSAEKIAP